MTLCVESGVVIGTRSKELWRKRVIDGSAVPYDFGSVNNTPPAKPDVSKSFTLIMMASDACPRIGKSPGTPASSYGVLKRRQVPAGSPDRVQAISTEVFPFDS